MTPAVPEPAELAVAAVAWLDQHAGELPDVNGSGRSFAARLRALRELQIALFDAGWVRFGWPESAGGMGGTSLHRAAVSEALASAGFADRGPFEHHEILLPVLIKRARPDQLACWAPPFLRGDELWAQGFSEPDAGSDLGALRTRAVLNDDLYRVNGSKIWTSWAGYANWCLVLTRTGSLEERHRGLTVLMVPLDAPGVTVRAINQANGHDELAEVIFDDVDVPSSNRIGAEGDGWAIGLEILSYERGTSSWLRQLLLRSRLQELLAVTQPTPNELGNVLLDLYALRLATSEALLDEAEGVVAGPAAAHIKLLRTDGEQHLHDLFDSALAGGLASGATQWPQVGRWQDEYLFSRAVSIYGGTRQMQLATIAKYELGI
jgi:alkylation response protein AidB-like acyl-CoA dehydrogenase